MSSIGTIQDNSIKIGGYFQITHPNDKSINEIFKITSIEYDPSKNQNKIIGYSIDELEYFIEIIRGKNYFYIEGFDQGYNVHFEERINDFYEQETLATTLPELVQKHLDENWNWYSLSGNPGIPIEFIEETLGKPGYKWKWYDISYNPNITPGFVRKHLHKINGWADLSENPGIPIEFIDETLGKPGYKWRWRYIGRNRNIPPEFIEKHLYKIKNWNELSRNPEIPIEFIDETLGQEGYGWQWGDIVYNTNITPEFVREHLNEIENWEILSETPRIPIRFIDETWGQPGYRWNIPAISDRRKERYKKQPMIKAARS